MVLAGFRSGARPFFEQYFEFRSSSVSNQLASQIMAWAAELGFAAAAERIVWILLFTGFTAVVVGNLARERREAVVFSLLLFPIFAGVLANLGFMNFLIGLILFTHSAFLLQAGLRRASMFWIVGLLAAAAATFLAHPLAGMALGVAEASFASCYVAHWLIVGRRRAEPSFSPFVPIGCVLSCLMLLALAAQAAFPQIVRFFSTTATSMADSIAHGPAVATTSSAPPDSLGTRLIDVFGFSYFVSYSPADYLFSLGFALVLSWLVWRRVREFWRSRACDRRTTGSGPSPRSSRLP